MEDTASTNCVWHQPYFVSLTPSAKLVYLYMMDRSAHGKHYLSLGLAARNTGLSEAVIEQYAHQFMVDRESPTFAIVEESEE